MKRNLSFMLAAALVLGFSAFALAQQPATTVAKQPVKTEHKTMMAHFKLSKEESIALQNALSKDGFYKGTASGVIDAATKQALRDYQKANQLKITGEPNKETLDKLGVAFTEPHGKTAEHPAAKKSEPAKSNQH